MLYVILPVAATQPDPLHSVTICHRTNSVTNPYVQITVDEASVDGNNGNDKGKGDHLLDHLGPVFDANNPPAPPHNGDQWGDIIPPFYADGSTLTGYPSLNWNQAGMALFNNGCNFPGESAEESTAGSGDESTGESGEESTGQSGEQTVEAGTGTPGASNPDTAGVFGSGSPFPTILFSLILLASLASLAVVNVKGARSRS